MNRECTKCKVKKDAQEFYRGRYSWCKECMREKMTERNRILKEQGIKYLNPKKAKTLRLRHLENVGEWKKFRAEVKEEIWALFWDLIIEYGLRIREALLIQVSDIDLTTNTLTIHVLKKKGAPTVEVTLPPELSSRIQVLAPTQGSLFPFAYATAFYRFKATAKRAGLNPRYSPHTLRHLAGTLAYEVSRDLKAVKEFLRHSDISSTDMYVHMSSKLKDELAEKIRKKRTESE